MWIAWANGSLHHELHGHDDARARSTFLLQILLLVLGLALVLLLSIPWGFAVARRLAGGADPPGTPQV